MIGNVYRLRSWQHHEPVGVKAPGLHTVTMAHPDKAIVGVFVLLGFERKDGSGERVDPVAAMKMLGWERPRKPASARR